MDQYVLRYLVGLKDLLENITYCSQIMKENKNGIQSSKSVYYDAETGRKLAIFFDENEFFYHFDGISVALDN